MKRVKFITVLMLFCISMMTQQTYANSQCNNTPKMSVVKLHNKVSSHRPKAPARYSVECTYTLGYMEFTFPSGVSYMRVEICEDETPIWEGIIAPDSPVIEIPMLYGEYNVVCTTDTGTVYSGTVYFCEEM